MLTVYEYLKAVPKRMFESTLIGMMGLELGSAEDAELRKIMDQPYTDFFPEIDFANIDTSQLSDLSVLGRTISSLPTDKQEQLKDAMKNYCEVCDFINSQTAQQQAAINFPQPPSDWGKVEFGAVGDHVLSDVELEKLNKGSV